MISNNKLYQTLSKEAQNLRRHFCGVQGCMCGSYHRAELTF